MKQIYLPIILMLILSSCNNNETTGPLNTEKEYIISGTIDSWNMGDTMTVRFERTESYLNGGMPTVFGSSKVGSDGKFSIQVSNPPSEYLGGIGEDLSKSYLPITYLFLYTPKGVFYKSLFNANNPNHLLTFVTGDYLATFCYSIKAAHITDTSKSWHGVPPNVDTIYYFTDLSLEKGWNRFEQKIISNNGNVTIHHSTVQALNSGNWYISN